MQWYIKIGRVNRMTSLRFNITPDWNIDDYKSLSFKRDTVKGQTTVQEYFKVGHKPKQMTMLNYFEPNPMPNSVEYVKTFFNDLVNVTAAVNVFEPGNYLPLHRDNYRKYRSVAKDVLQGRGIEAVYRYVVMLEDSAAGQMMHIKDTIHHTWVAGDVFGWVGDEMHTFYNMSLKDRYAIQITGIQT